MAKILRVYTTELMHKTPAILIGVTTLAANLIAATTPCFGDSDIDNQETFRVMTLNLAHGRGLAKNQAGIERSRIESNLGHVAALITDMNPNIVAVQEADAASTWSGGFSHVEFLSRHLNTTHQCHGLHVDIRLFPVAIRYGTGLLANTPWSQCTSIEFNNDWRDTKGFVVGHTKIDNREVTVVSVHLDYRSQKRRSRQAALLITHCRDVSGPLIVMGDFNTDGKSADALNLIRNELNLSAHKPDALDPPNCTYPSRQPDQRIDWILISNAFQFVRYGAHKQQVSDHLAVWADLTWR